MPKDYPFKEVCAAAERLAHSGCLVHQKWTCSNCGVRQTMPDANHFYTNGKCEECNHLTNIEQTGCNYLVIYYPSSSQELVDYLSNINTTGKVH